MTRHSDAVAGQHPGRAHARRAVTPGRGDPGRLDHPPVWFGHFAARLAVVNRGWSRGCDSAYPAGDPGRRPGSSSQGNVTSCAAATRNAATSS
jgi:hypothetical protein